MNNKNLLALQHLKKYGINIHPKHQKYIIAYPYQEDIFPVFLVDDGGYDYFDCELPICENGDLIQVGQRYDTHDFDNCLVKKMKLEGFRMRWSITIDDQGGGELDLLAYEFLNIAF